MTVNIYDRGFPGFEFIENVVWDYFVLEAEDMLLDIQADALCFAAMIQGNTITRNAIEEFLKHIPEYVLRDYDVNLRQNIQKILI